MPASLKISALAAAAAVTAALAGCSAGGGSASTSAASSSPTTIASLKHQAEREHGLVIYGNAPSQYFQPVIAAFTKVYPFIKVSETTLADNTVFSKYEAEAAQGARTADLLIASAPASWVQAEQTGVSANVTPTGLGAFPSWVNQGHGVFVMSAEPVLLAYSPKLLTPAEVPTTWAQLVADAKANPVKYRLGFVPNQQSAELRRHLRPDPHLGRQQGLELLRLHGAADQNLRRRPHPADSGAAGRRVGRLHELPVWRAGSCRTTRRSLRAYVFMKDATPLIPRAITVTKHAASPASAQLFLDFLYTQAGQDALCAAGFEATMTDYHSTNTGCTASLTALQSQVPPNTSYLVPISQAVLDQQSAITKSWNQAFHR